MGGLIAPFRDGLSHLLGDRAGLSGVQLKVLRHGHRQRQGRCTVVLIDGRGQYARLDVGRHGVEIVGRGQTPAVAAMIKKTVIAQMASSVLDMRMLKTMRRQSASMSVFTRVAPKPAVATRLRFSENGCVDSLSPAAQHAHGRRGTGYGACCRGSKRQSRSTGFLATASTSRVGHRDSTPYPQV